MKTNNIKHRLKRIFVKHKKVWLVLGLFVIALGFLVAIPFVRIKGRADIFLIHAKEAKQAYEIKDIGSMRLATQAMHEDITFIQTQYSRLRFLRSFLWVNQYYVEGTHLLSAAVYGLDAGEMVLAGVQPFAEVLGFYAGAPDTSVQEKLQQLTLVAPQLIPVVDEAALSLQEAIEELEQLNPKLYPKRLRGIEIRTKVTQIHDNAPVLADVLSDVRPFLENLPAALGEPTPAQYLVLFMNDKERRPIMGFITAFTRVSFNRGEFSVASSSDIYDVSDEESFLPLPLPLAVYLKAGGFHLRDINFSPDYGESIDNFLYYWGLLGQQGVHGVISLDTEFLEALLRVTGPIELPQYVVDYTLFPGIPESCLEGNTAFSAENVVCRLELFSQKIVLTPEKRKAILGDLMNEMVEWILSAPQEAWGDLFAIIWQQLEEKHLLLDFQNEQLQALADKYNLGGRVVSQSPQQFWAYKTNCEKGSCDAPQLQQVNRDSVMDYLYVNDANLAGLKSDMFITRSVKQTIREEEGRFIKRVEITYHNTQPQDGWLNAVGRNYTRVYVPLGSELLSFDGGDQFGGVGVSEDLGFSVFDNFILIPPLEERTVVFEYVLPFSTWDGVFVQKQPGLDTAKYIIETARQTYEFDLETDINIVVSR